ncbi:MAG: hypothetical protein IKD42_00065 [Kiritimatiellae bacterium]|nr:hypothetical protein [Kiritimatiellia bacterium]
MNKMFLSAAAVFAAIAAHAVTATIKTAADTMTGDVKWQNGSKTYALAKGTIVREYALKDVVKIDVPRPQTLDRAAEMVKRGQASMAIQTLTGLMHDYRMLTWDRTACRYLVEAYLKTGNPQKAYDTANVIVNDDKTAAWTGEVAPFFWQALLKLGKKNALEACLDKAASSGSRPASAHALVMRGDMIIDSEGETAESCRKALIDAYLRVALMYTDAECSEARHDALEKGAGCLDKIGLPQKAAEFRKKASQISR